MKMTKKLVAGCLFASISVLAAVPFTASAATKLKLGWTTTDSPNDPYAAGAHAFGDAIAKASNGEITVQYYPNRQLGDEKQMLEGLRFGTIDAAVITNAVVAQMEPAFQLNDLPFMFADEEHAYQLLDGEVGQELAAKLDAKGVKVLGYMEGGFRHMLNNARPVNSPADVEGVKYRVMQNPVFIDMFNALGGSAVPMAWGETFTAVQQGTIDGLEIPLAVIVGNKYYEITKYLSLTGHTYSANLLLMSKRAFNKLTPEQQAQVTEAAKIATAAQRKANVEAVQMLITEAKDNGMQVNRLESTQAFRKAVEPIYAKYREQIGADLMDMALKTAK
ncbi:putative periplasmic substrate-binding transport protein [Pusillimonas sp. T7-7]|uniref:TRAP transporter substrate-binding protein n=1 Tax=Pusillimonas sp. (strain T7-7) TaxID=1007105 RepID=UPI0002084F72|nr:TRAP transporter substrate-binding protein [Pusillimonas sp. T7-7]AEC21787.1 putative periplasmic substrate-binding transport protein [Pusillimonas sp. T7-7]